jgi:hypothetical protein
VKRGQPTIEWFALDSFSLFAFRSWHKTCAGESALSPSLMHTASAATFSRARARDRPARSQALSCVLPRFPQSHSGRVVDAVVLELMRYVGCLPLALYVVF